MVTRKIIQLNNTDLSSGSPPRSQEFALILSEEMYEYEMGEDDEGSMEYSEYDSLFVRNCRGRTSWLSTEHTNIHGQIELDLDEECDLFRR